MNSWGGGRRIPMVKGVSKSRALLERPLDEQREGNEWESEKRSAWGTHGPKKNWAYPYKDARMIGNQPGKEVPVVGKTLLRGVLAVDCPFPKKGIWSMAKVPSDGEKRC